MLDLSAEERGIAAGTAGPAQATAMRILAESGALLGATRLLPIVSAHIDGCLYHGDSGVLFAERLVELGGRVKVPSTLNVGALDLTAPGRVRADAHLDGMGRRMARAYQSLGCKPTWTCSPYQAGHRPAMGAIVAWGESNAVAFCNSVLGARTNRNGDFLDICAALAGRAPEYGLLIAANRRARIVVDARGLPARLTALEAFYPVLGAWLGHEAGETVAAVLGLPADISEDRLKAMGAAAASTGAVGLFHIVGRTPEAPTLEAALGGSAPERTIVLTPAMVRAARDALSAVREGPVDAAAIGSPHLSLAEFDELERLLAGRRLAAPLYACTGRHVLSALDGAGRRAALESAGVKIVADTCVVVTPILPAQAGVLMTNSAKFAHYAAPNTGYRAVFGSLADVVESAVAGRVVRDETSWGAGA